MEVTGKFIVLFFYFIYFFGVFPVLIYKIFKTLL